MLSNGIHCSVDRFKTMAAAIQQKALDKAIEQVAPTEAQ